MYNFHLYNEREKIGLMVMMNELETTLYNVGCNVYNCSECEYKHLCSDLKLLKQHTKVCFNSKFG